MRSWGELYSKTNALITLHSLVGVSGGERLAIDIDHGLLSEIWNDQTHSTERERTTCVLYRHTWGWPRRRVSHLRTSWGRARGTSRNHRQRSGLCRKWGSQEAKKKFDENTFKYDWKDSFAWKKSRNLLNFSTVGTVPICEKNFRLFTNPYEFLKYKMLTLLKLGAPSVLGAPSASLSMPSKASVIATRVSTEGAILSDLRLHWLGHESRSGLSHG